MKIEVWSDVVCPWCYIGKHRLDEALAGYEHAAEVEVSWRSFELDPDAPREPQGDGDYIDRLAAKYGRTREQAQEMVDGTVAAGAEAGVELRFDRIQPGNSFDAHRLIHRAGRDGVGTEMTTRLFDAYFTEGAAIADHATLARLAADVGLDESEATEFLGGASLGDEVRADEQQAARFRIGGVPFFVINGKYGMQGAQPAETIVEVLERARADGAAA